MVAPFVEYNYIYSFFSCIYFSNVSTSSVNSSTNLLIIALLLYKSINTYNNFYVSSSFDELIPVSFFILSKAFFISSSFSADNLYSLSMSSLYLVFSLII